MEERWSAQATASSRSGEVTGTAAMMEFAKGPSPWLDWGCEGVERVDQCKAQLCV